MDPSICSEKKTSEFARHLSDHYEEISKSISQPFVYHNINKYGGLPIWAAVELWSFGHLSSYLDTLCTEAKTDIAAPFNTDASRISGWFHNLSTVRNICAHSGRIYNRDINIGVKLYPEDARLISTPRRLMDTLFVIKRIYANKGKWTYFVDAMHDLIQQNNSIVDITALGFPKFWYHALTNRRKETD
jgi:abortive infection bacteriophage resistance protein